MSLSTARSTAQSIFNNTARQTSVIGTNISNVQNGDYNKRTVMIVSTEHGARVGSVYREENAALFRQSLESNSSASAQATLTDGLTKEIANLLGGGNYDRSPNTYLSTFRDTLSSYGAKPADTTLAAGVVSAAKDLVQSLNSTSTGLQAIRQDADKKINEQVGNLNALLASFETVNTKVIQATSTGNDPNSALDERDALLKKISDLVGIYSVTRENGDMALYTSEGTTLFETIPRVVSTKPMESYNAGAITQDVFIDGVAITPGDGGDTSAKGSLQALLQIRDQVAPTYQRQLDEIATALILMFKEENQNGNGSFAAGLFYDIKNPSLPILPDPAAGEPKEKLDIKHMPVDDMSTRIRISAAVLPPTGNPALIRDGGIAGEAYRANPDGSSGYSELLDNYVESFEDVKFGFSDSSSIGGDQSVLDFSTASVGWFESLRSSASNADETKTALMARTSEAYSNVTSVSLDEELSLLLDVEQSYKAGTKLLSTIDEMIKTLLDSVG
ncbi:flagellar hook-associated protein FlgK [Rhizobium sp. SAFR-030]|uniref:flagellar hook-associated protein FlgK n=1 Tax=Rhizobium sp. SAFR-030 TaxID=3387277 RepID=UPI003F8099B8